MWWNLGDANPLKFASEGFENEQQQMRVTACFLERITLEVESRQQFVSAGEVCRTVELPRPAIDIGCGAAVGR
ncbi:MAG: hypothetical protein N3C12_07625 [Candidatus Binatia bacterium]|nr:hypothetical protein [Candidatus Binatia bacterium]